MPEEVAHYRVFIAAPGGLEQERRTFAQTLTKYNEAEAVQRQAWFYPVGWEDTRAGVGRPQALINKDLDKCDYFVLVLWDRWGTPPGGSSQYTSGTDEEFHLAMEHISDHKHRMSDVVVFFKGLDDRRLRDPGEQLRKVLRFKNEVEENRTLLFHTFTDIADFEHKLRCHLGEWLRNHDLTSTTRIAQERARVPDTEAIIHRSSVASGKPIMAPPAIRAGACALSVNIFSGARSPIPSATDVQITLRDGNQQTVPLSNNGFLNESSILIGGLPFFDNFGDNYAVVASADGYQQAGFFPVTVNPVNPAVVDIMLLKKNATFNFRNASWDRLNQQYPGLAALLGAGAADNASAADRYGQLMEDRPQVLACYFNLVTAMSQIQLPVKTPLDYIRELIWDDTMQQDRFFAWADPAMIDQMIQTAELDEFSPEAGSAMFHPGATRSWKQIQFGEANVRLTFHEDNKKTINGLDCVMVEPDIDYYKDRLAHALLEVTTNRLTNSLTDPRQVYVLRWMAGRHAGVPSFEPPYFLA